MSDPFRDAAARKRASNRDRIRHEYTPIVLWVKAPGGERVHEARKWAQEKLDQCPYTHVATSHEPYWFATDGTNRIEDAESGGTTEGGHE